MGGIGSGRRWHLYAKDTTSDYLSIDVRRWQRDGLLKPDQWFGWQWKSYGEVAASIQVYAKKDRVTLMYRYQRNGGDWKDESYPVYLDWTECHLGGKRPWFLCPASGCGQRVALLYLGGIFACRHCYQLAYQSQRAPPHERAAHRADRIREKLGWEPGIVNGKGWKPKGMHCTTFERLTKEHDNFVQYSMAELAAKLNLLR